MIDRGDSQHTDDAIQIAVDPANPHPGLEAAADIVASGQAGVWWISCNEITLHSEDALVAEDGETAEDIKQWALNHLLTGWVAMATLTLGEAPAWPEGAQP